MVGKQHVRGQSDGHAHHVRVFTKQNWPTCSTNQRARIQRVCLGYVNWSNTFQTMIYCKYINTLCEIMNNTSFILTVNRGLFVCGMPRALHNAARELRRIWTKWCVIWQRRLSEGTEGRRAAGQHVKMLEKINSSGWAPHHNDVLKIDPNLQCGPRMLHLLIRLLGD